MNEQMKKFIESFGAVRNPDGTFTLSEAALIHMIKTAQNMGADTGL